MKIFFGSELIDRIRLRRNRFSAFRSHLEIYDIPELSTVGVSEAEAIKTYGKPIIGVANFNEIAHGQISALQKNLREAKSQKI